MRTEDFVGHLKSLPSYSGQVCHVEHVPGRGAEYGDGSLTLPASLDAALRHGGIHRLYTHQAESVRAVREGLNVVVTTPTASGKTLCYNIPVLEEMLKRPDSRALYLFPTKALAQDQMRNLADLARRSCPEVTYATYDGDTPRSSRASIRKVASIILSNPDMLHLGILPNHRMWSPFLRNLRFVVVDEAHVYRGVFGSHVACILRRLRRLCQRYGSRPLFICSSATIANPAEHIEGLTGLPPLVVSEDGAPRGSRDFVLWNPPMVDEKHGKRRSANLEASHLFSELVQHGLRNITFVKARKVAELILRYSRDILAEADPAVADLVRSYRAGYLPRERREIEQALFHGQLLGVIATTALELGVDIGSLDATVLVGYPGTIASTWQQAGRAGRGVNHALSFLVGLDNPLDQYFMHHPESLFGRSHENALLDPGNPYVLTRHLGCAAYEAPLSAEDVDFFGPRFAEAVSQLVTSGDLERRHNRWYYPGSDYPAEQVSIRSMSQDSFCLIDESQGGAVLEELDGATAFSRVHPGAVYLHQGETYLVKELNLRAKVARASAVDLDYYTQPREVSELSVAETTRMDTLAKVPVCLGQVQVTEQVVGFRRKELLSDVTLEEEHLDLPSRSFSTVALWFGIPEGTERAIRKLGLDLHGGLHGVEHASIGILPLFAMCDRQDIGGLSTPCHAETGRAQIFIYDGFPGGVGIAEKGYELLPELWEATLRSIENCPCDDGCPSCIHSPKCGNYNQPLDKRASVVILKALLESRGLSTPGIQTSPLGS